jgi:hypothetical protein
MLPYILLYCLAILFIFLDQSSISLEKKKIASYSLVFIFTLFRGLRWKTGTDWEQFYDVFVYGQWDNIFSYQRYGEQKLEYGYVFFNVLVKSLGGNYTVFLLASNFVILYCYHRFSFAVSKTPLLVFVLILFYTPFFPVRLTLATAIVLLGYEHALKGSWVKFAIPVLVASSIHTSALFFLVFYFLFRIKTPTPWAILIFVVTIAASYLNFQNSAITFLLSKLTFLGDMVTLRLQTYIEFERLTNNFRNSIMSNTLVMAFLLLYSWFRDKKYPNSPNFNACYNAFIAYFFLSEFFRVAIEQLARTANYFSVFSPVLLAKVVSDISEIKEYKVLVYAALVVYILYKFYNTLNFIYPEVNIPYKSVLD